MNVSKAITIDLNDPRREIVHLEQGDNGTRQISLTLLKDGAAYDITSDAGGATVTKGVSYIKANDVGGYYETTSTGATAVAAGGASNIWTVTLDNHVTDVVGLAKINVKFSLASGKVLHSFPIWIDVDQTAATTGTDPNAPYYQSSAFIIAGLQPSKTSAMTKAVGIDGNGVLWAEKTTLAQLGCCRHVATGSAATWTADVSGWQLTHGGYLFIYFGDDVGWNAVLNVSGSGSKQIWYRGERIRGGMIKAGDRCLFVYVSGDNERYDLIAIDRASVKNSLEYLGCGFFSAYIPTGGTDGAYVALKSDFTLTHGAYLIVAFLSAVAANATLNINDTGAKPIYWRSGAIAGGVVKTNDRCLLQYDTNSGGRYYLIALDRGVDAILKSNQMTKTSAMTQRVGIDADGKLWVPPAEGGGGTTDGAVLYSEAQTLTDEEKAQARTNIGATEGAVLYSEAQTLTDEEKAQARSNIGAYQKPSTGITSSDLSSAVNASLTRANNAVPTTNFNLPYQGIGYTGCGSLDEVTQKMAYLEGYELRVGGFVAVHFTYPVNAGSTLRIYKDNSFSGYDVPIYWQGSAITSGIIKSGDTCLFVFDGNSYNLLAIDSDAPSLSAVLYSAQILTEPQKAQARSNIGAVGEPIEIPLSGSTVTIDEAQDNVIYVCGEVSTLTVTARATNAAFTLIFNSPAGSTPTDLTMPVDVQMPDDFAVDVYAHYEINVDKRGFAVASVWHID